MNKWLGSAALIPALAMVFMDQSILPVALPAIQEDLGASSVALNWCVNSYLLAIAIFVLIGGKLSDRIGHRTAFIAGMILFTVASVLCGMSFDVDFLIGARALQGMGGALMFPAQTALLALLFPPKERGRASGLNVSISSLFLVLGPLIGGYLTLISWRLIFWINVPIALLGIVMTYKYLPKTDPGGGKIDNWGFAYFASFCASLIIALMQGEEWGWGSVNTKGLLAWAFVSLGLLIHRERATAHPFLDLTLFKHRIFTSINLSISVTQLILMVGVFRAVYFQKILGYTAPQAGLLTFATSLPVLFLSSLGGYLSDKISPKLPIAIGFLFLIFSFIWLGFDATPSLSGLLIALIPFGMGVPLIFTPSYSAAMGSVPARKMGVAFGMVSTLRNLSATLGVVLVSFFVGTSELPEAQIAGFSRAHFALGFLLILTFAVVFVLHKAPSSHHLPDSPAEGWD